MFSPACKAQSEIAPDHFEGGNTEPFEKVAAPTVARAHTVNPHSASAARTAQAKSSQSVQLAAVHDASKPSPQGAVATDKKHNAAARKPKQ